MVTENWQDDALASLVEEYETAREDAPHERPVAATRRHHTRYEQRMAARDAAAPIACRSGCAFCCYLRVSVRPHEALTLAAALREQPADEQQRLRAGLERNAQRIRAMSATEHLAAQLPCAFLGEDRRCSVYAHRPSACRRYHSTSVDACKASFEQPHNLQSRISISNPRVVASLTLELAYRKVLDEGQRDVGAYELHTAVLEAFDDAAGCAERWARGTRVLVQALPGEAPERAVRAGEGDAVCP
jgi:Fe-S-cluster containining protein